MITYKTGFENLPKPFQTFLSVNIRLGNEKYDMKKNIIIEEAESLQEFEEEATRLDALAQRIKQTEPFVRFYYIAFHMPDILGDENDDSLPVLLFYDMGLDGISFAINGDNKIVGPKTIE